MNALKDDDSGDHDQNEESTERRLEPLPLWNSSGGVYGHMAGPGDLTGHSDFHIYKEGIKPILILAMLEEQFTVGEEICGAVVSTVSDQTTIAQIQNMLSGNIKMPGSVGPQRLLFQNLWKLQLNVP
ncbi:unnamed protein product [Nyctereutes procyonoides]|uniref:(raccoon dog) hypothetical protein n=1 Tax=Nyctereutes procyonoides TaxID=34880 RepID=A0A811Z0V5_NYCPR|nr:unnamed protein product [Nyctereutes procyonoides]